MAGATLAIGLPVWLAVWQNRNEKQKRREADDLKFQLKAAEIAMNATESYVVRGRAAALEALFRERLPDGFAKNLDPSKVRFGVGTQLRLEFLKILAENPSSREFLVNVWALMWPGDADPAWDGQANQDYSMWKEHKTYLDEQTPYTQT